MRNEKSRRILLHLSPIDKIMLVGLDVSKEDKVNDVARRVMELTGPGRDTPQFRG